MPRAHDHRRSTRFGSWLSEYGVERLRRDLHEREGLPLFRSSSVFDWLSGRHSPRLDVWAGIERLACGALTIDDAIEHRGVMERERAGRVGPC